jgi:hypothetical protein
MTSTETDSITQDTQSTGTQQPENPETTPVTGQPEAQPACGGGGCPQEPPPGP